MKVELLFISISSVLSRFGWKVFSGIPATKVFLLLYSKAFSNIAAVSVTAVPRRRRRRRRPGISD